MKRLENNVPYISANERIGKLKNKVLGIDSSCNITDGSSNILSYKNPKISYLRVFQSSKSHVTAGEKILNTKKKCIPASPLKKLKDCSGIQYIDKSYVKKPPNLKNNNNLI